MKVQKPELHPMARPQLRLTDFPGHLSAEAFWRLVGTVEHETLDFKGGPNDSFKELLPAMAMTDGGIAILGVSDDDDQREIVGCPLTQKTQDRITQYANECDIQVKLKSFMVDEFELIVVEVPEVSDRIVTTPNGRLLRRVGGDSQPLQGDALAMFVLDRRGPSAEEMPLDRPFDPSEFDLDAVNGLLARLGRPEIDCAGLARALVDLHVAEFAPNSTSVDDPVVLTAAAVLFALDPRRYVPAASVRLRRRFGIGPGPGPVEDDQECFGPLVSVVECCDQFVRQHTRSHEVVTGMFRDTIPEYPTAVVREAVLNALAHRDYGLEGTTVDITVWDDRIEVQSPGPLPGHITVDNMRDEHFSRNRRMMRVLRDMGLVEEFGEGVDRMYREMEERLMNPPEFESNNVSVKVTLRNQFLVDVEEQAWLQMLGGWAGTAAHRRMLIEVRRRGEAAKRHFSEVLHDVDIDAALAHLLSHGLLERVGQAGGTQYRLSDAVVMRAGTSQFSATKRRRELVLEELASRGSMSTAEAARLLGEDRQSVRELLNELASAGLVQAEGNTRARRYVAVRQQMERPPVSG